MNGTALESSSCKSSPPVPSAGTPSREPPAWKDLHTGLLRSGIVTLPGTAGPQRGRGGLWRDSAMLLEMGFWRRVSGFCQRPESSQAENFLSTG